MGAGGDVFAAQTGFGPFCATLTPDAPGSFSYLASTNGQNSTIDCIIENRIRYTPEPTTAGLLGLAGLSLIARRRESAA